MGRERAQETHHGKTVWLVREILIFEGISGAMCKIPEEGKCLLSVTKKDL